MFRNEHLSSESQGNARHRYQAWKEDQRRNGSLSDGQPFSGGLDLSIHMPRSSGNRFEVLRPPSPPPKASDSPYVHRVRHGRGSKEAKRHRDARRNQRKIQAVWDLDAKLTRHIDRTLSQAKISPPRRCTLPSPAPVQSAATISKPETAWTKPTPPQLPHFNFSGLDLIDDCPQPTPRPTPKRIDSGISTLKFATPMTPTWRSEQPLLTGKNPKWSDYPLYLDLSKLPEPVLHSKPEPSGRELQLWRPQAVSQPKKQSRFFPSTASAKPTVKLPPTSCKLHSDNNGVEPVEPPKPKTLAESLEQVVKAAETARKLACNKESDKSAANLWKILTSSEQPTRVDDNDLFPGNVSYQPLEDVYVAPDGIYDHRLQSVGMPVELDNAEFPYVHANCLTGHANERGSEPYPPAEEDITICEAPGKQAYVEEAPDSLNEMAMDPYTEDYYTNALLAILDLPPLPPSPVAEDKTLIVTDPHPTDPVLISDSSTQAQLESSDAHFKSEQSLFHPHPLTPRTPDDDLVDVATFLKMGHATNCWCNDCAEPHASLSSETCVEEDGWMVYSSIDDQDWQTWSHPTTPNESQDWQSWSHPTTPDDEPDFRAWTQLTPLEDRSASSAWEWEWGTFVHDEEQHVDTAPPPYRPTWDEAFPCKPSSVAHRAW